jgi:deoxyribonuclease-4
VEPLRAGAHVGGGITGYVRNAAAAGCDAFQVFASNPRGWAETKTSEEADAAVRRQMREAGLHGMFIHAPYLVNVATAEPMFQAKSVRSVAWTMQRAAALGATGVVVHAGAGGATSSRADAVARAAAALLVILERCPPEPLLIVELTAGGGNSVASRWDQAAELLDAADAHPRVRFCFDTCHAHAAGYDLSSREGAERCWSELDAHVGVDRLALVHANDSRDPCGSRRDRHERVGLGTIGDDGFRALLSHPFSRRAPWIIEVPPATHAEDLVRLRALAAEAG